MFNTVSSPRPILKRSCSTGQSNHPANAVHFPPSPSLTRTFTAHSSTAYDRSPIVVSQNSCALPERGCPGRTYSLEEEPCPPPDHRQKSPSAPAPRGHAHPRAWSNYTSTDPSTSAVPGLIPDLSSESDESDGFTSPPLFPYARPPSIPMSSKYPIADIQLGLDPSQMHSIQQIGYTSYPLAVAPGSVDMSPTPKSTARRRRKSPPSSPYQMLEEDEHDPGYDDDDDTPTPSSSPVVSTDRERRRSKKFTSVVKPTSSFRQLEDDGCLGGF